MRSVVRPTGNDREKSEQNQSPWTMIDMYLGVIHRFFMNGRAAAKFENAKFVLSTVYAGFVSKSLKRYILNLNHQNGFIYMYGGTV